MTYYQFVQAIEKKVKKEIKECARISVYTTQKYNGTMRQGLLFSEQGSNVSPTIYLEEYYRRFEQGGSIDQIVKEILSLYAQLRFKEPWEESLIRDYTNIKEKMVYRLIHREKNLEILENMPYISYLDLAIVFYILFEAGIYGMAAMPVKTEHLRQWGITTGQAYQCAKDNTCRLLPCEFKTMRAVMAELTGMPETEEEDVLFVLSNEYRSFGAAAVLYPGELERIGECLGEDFFVLPSSVHEMLIVRKSVVLGKEALSRMVAEINATQVAKEEVLSDRAYYYSRAEKMLNM